MAAAACLVGLAPAGARADTAPAITSGPAIAGTPQVGARLVASATWTGDPAPTATWGWMRCAPAGGACSAIAGAKSRTYRVVEADAGSLLRVRLRVSNGAGNAEAGSDPTEVVAPAPSPAPSPTPTPTPTPTATPTTPTPIPTSSPAPSPTPPASTTAPPAMVAVVAPQLLDPFPVVRIKGRLTLTGARVTLFSVRAPRAAQVTVACGGRDCPRHRYRPAPGPARLRPFERSLRAGIRFTVAVTEPGFVGKLTVIVIRRRAAPRRTDRCLVPGAAYPVRCSTL